MTRHGRNATNAAVYSYHERRKDAKESGWGSEKARFSKDSVKGFDCCSLMLQVRFSQIVKEFTNQIYICTSENLINNQNVNMFQNLIDMNILIHPLGQ